MFRANLSNSVKLPYKRLRSRLMVAADFLSRGLFISRGLFKPRLIFARINGPNFANILLSTSRYLCFHYNDLHEFILVLFSIPCCSIGVFETRCLGFYCGYCPLAIVMIFASYIQCKMLANQTALNTGAIKINLSDWVLHPGYYDVKVS